MAMLFEGVGRPFRQVPQILEPLSGSEIRVRVICCTLCRSDLSTQRGLRVEPMPTILGHEVVGVIDSFGPEAVRTDAAGQPASVGDRVTWAVVASCGSCFFCKNGLPQKCDRGYKYGHVATRAQAPDGGGLAELITLVPGTSWFRVPERVSDAVAAFANCSVATIAAVMEAAGELAGRSIAVIGAGMLGLIACAMAREAGAAVIVAVDPNPDARERVLQFGATAAVDATSEDVDEEVFQRVGERGPDVVLELAGLAETAEQAMAWPRLGGRVVMAGAVSPTNLAMFDPQQIVRRMMTIQGVHNYRPDHLRQALAFLDGPGQRYPFDSLVAATYLLDEVDAAFKAAAKLPGQRVAVFPSD
jgi:alcohol dehydrogenase